MSYQSLREKGSTTFFFEAFLGLRLFFLKQCQLVQHELVGECESVPYGHGKDRRYWTEGENVKAGFFRGHKRKFLAK